MLAIAGGKGGCGKTTAALGIARTLARRGCDPLLVDADCDMPDLHHLAGIHRDEGLDELAEGTRPLSSVVRRPSTFPGVALLTAGQPTAVEPGLRQARAWQGPILVDCPAGIGPDAVSPLREADATLLVSTDERQARDDTARTARVAQQVGARPVGVLYRTLLDDQTVTEIAGCPIIAAVGSCRTPLESPAVAQTLSNLANDLRDRDVW